MLDRLYALETFGIKLGLENISRLCAALGHPERAFRSLHVAGTNGKGSVAAIAHTALVRAGVRAGLYTSPHLVALNERFVVGGAAVDDGSLEAVATDVLDCADALVASGVLHAPPTFFEATTAIGFELFRRARIEVAVLEVGLGGRFDATNVVHPSASAITSIGFDHQQHLGDTLEAIAFEKAGIIKPGVTTVIGRLPDVAEAVTRRVAAERRASIVRGDEHVVMRSRMDAGRGIIDLTTPADHYGPLPLALRGEHQIENALTAIRLLEIGRAAGIPMTSEAIEHALAHTEWPGRLELLAIAGGRQVLLDAAHNRDGAAALARYLLRWHPERPPLVFAVMRDKDIGGILRVLLPAVGSVVATAPAIGRAADPLVVAATVAAADPERRVIVENDPSRAVERALEQAPLVCVAGSIYLVGAVRGALYGRAILR